MRRSAQAGFSVAGLLGLLVMLLGLLVLAGAGYLGWNNYSSRLALEEAKAGAREQAQQLGTRMERIQAVLGDALVAARAREVLAGEAEPAAIAEAVRARGVQGILDIRVVADPIEAVDPASLPGAGFAVLDMLVEARREGSAPVQAHAAPGGRENYLAFSQRLGDGRQPDAVLFMSLPLRLAVDAVSLPQGVDGMQLRQPGGDQPLLLREYGRGAGAADPRIPVRGTLFELSWQRSAALAPVGEAEMALAAGAGLLLIVFGFVFRRRAARRVRVPARAARRAPVLGAAARRAPPPAARPQTPAPGAAAAASRPAAEPPPKAERTEAPEKTVEPEVTGESKEDAEIARLLQEELVSGEPEESLPDSRARADAADPLEGFAPGEAIGAEEKTAGEQEDWLQPDPEPQGQEDRPPESEWSLEDETTPESEQQAEPVPDTEPPAEDEVIPEPQWSLEETWQPQPGEEESGPEAPEEPEWNLEDALQPEPEDRPRPEAGDAETGDADETRARPEPEADLAAESAAFEGELEPAPEQDHWPETAPGDEPEDEPEGLPALEDEPEFEPSRPREDEAEPGDDEDDAALAETGLDLPFDDEEEPAGEPDFGADDGDFRAGDADLEPETPADDEPAAGFRDLSGPEDEETGPPAAEFEADEPAEPEPERDFPGGEPGLPESPAQTEAPPFEEAEVEAEAEPGPGIEAEARTGYEFEAEPEPGPEDEPAAPPEAEAEPGPEPESDTETEPEPELEDELEPETPGTGEEEPEEPEPQRAAGPAAAGIDPSIFRAYDIRGVVGKTLWAEVAARIGRAIGSETRARGLDTVAVARDGRLSGPELLDAIGRGLMASGVDVIEIGAVPTPVLYYAACELAEGSGVMVTGSHNPPDYNGFKIMLGGETLSGDGISNLYRRLTDGDLSSGRGGLEQQPVEARYMERIGTDIQIERPLKVVVDCGNGITGNLAPKLLRAIGAEVIPLYTEVDGTFPNHHPDPGDPANLEDLKLCVRNFGADFGVAFDGDGDRLGVVSGDGEIIYPDRLLMLFARDVLARNPGAPIIFDVKCSGLLAREIEAAGGRPVMTRTGHSFIKRELKEQGAPLAGEMSGHFFFGERWYGFDDGLYAACRLLEILAADARDPTEILSGLPRAVSTPELKVAMAEGEPHAFVEAFREKAEFEGAEIHTIDGLRADFPDGWGLVRASNTTPVVVLRFEGDDDDALARIQEAFREQMLAVRPDLELPF